MKTVMDVNVFCLVDVTKFKKKSKKNIPMETTDIPK